MSRIAVIGAGPAGLTAGHRLRAAGHAVTIFEERDVPGGRTHSEHYGPGHWSDTGAGWLAAFYPRTLACSMSSASAAACGSSSSAVAATSCSTAGSSPTRTRSPGS